MRWNIEVLNKECKSYLALGQCQGRNFNGQIADCTLCFMTYIVLALGKRFSTYETIGEMFRAEKELLLALTLWNRLLACIEKILMALAELLGAEPMVMIQGLLNNNEHNKEVMVIANALQEYYSKNQ